MSDYVVVKPAIVTIMDAWVTVWSSDLVRSSSLVKAINHGWSDYGHDDWLIARLDGDRLIGLSWMDDEREDRDEFPDLAAGFGWSL